MIFGVGALLLFAAIELLAIRIQPSTHPWGRFEPGSWQTVRVTTEAFAGGGDSTTDIADVTTRLVRIDKDGVVLARETKRGDAVTEDGETKYAWDGTIFRGTADEKYSVSEFYLEGRTYTCQKHELRTEENGRKTMTKAWYSPDQSPYFLKTLTKIKGNRREMTLMEVTALNVEKTVLDEQFQCWESERVTSSKVAKKHRRSYSTMTVPGGIILAESETVDSQQGTMSTKRVELIAYSGIGATAADGNLISRENILPNGDFDKGDGGPFSWQRIDGLTTFWVKDPDPERGMVLKVDTDVLQAQAYKWWSRLANGADPRNAPLKAPTTEPKYDTLAGLDGVFYWSNAIPIEHGKKYWITVDVKGQQMFVWLVGYAEIPDLSFAADNAAVQSYLAKAGEGSGRISNTPSRTTDKKGFFEKYSFKGRMDAGGSDEWQTYSRRNKPFGPTRFTPDVKYVRIMLYPYWPPGEYYIDNVNLVEYDPERHGEKSGTMPGWH
jgi:hypothetical protein